MTETVFDRKGADMGVLFWCWYVTAFVAGGAGLFAVLLGDAETITRFGLELTSEMRAAIYTTMVVDSGWRMTTRISL